MAFPVIQWSKDAERPAGTGVKLNKEGTHVESELGYIDQAFQIAHHPRRYHSADVEKAARVCANQQMQALVINCQEVLAERKAKAEKKESRK